MEYLYCVKGVRIRSFSGPYFPTFRLSISPYSVRMRENTDQKNFEYGQFLRSALFLVKIFKDLNVKKYHNKIKCIVPTLSKNKVNVFHVWSFQHRRRIQKKGVLQDEIYVI